MHNLPVELSLSVLNVLQEHLLRLYFHLQMLHTFLQGTRGLLSERIIKMSTVSHYYNKPGICFGTITVSGCFSCPILVV